MIPIFCQTLILAMLISSLFLTLWRDINSVKERGPTGFSGVATTIVITALLALCYWKAGAFSLILPS